MAASHESSEDSAFRECRRHKGSRAPKPNASMTGIEAAKFQLNESKVHAGIWSLHHSLPGETHIGIAHTRDQTRAIITTLKIVTPA
jgi:hypothetical protein